MQHGRHPERPYVLLAQQSRFDPTRAPAGVADGVGVLPRAERFDGRHDRPHRGADRALRPRIPRPDHRPPHDEHRRRCEAHDANYIGGDINGGVADLRQFVARPTLGLHPWRTPIEGVYLCSSSTPPGGGVHGMCGWHAAHEVLRSNDDETATTSRRETEDEEDR